MVQLNVKPVPAVIFAVLLIFIAYGVYHRHGGRGGGVDDRTPEKLGGGAIASSRRGSEMEKNMKHTADNILDFFEIPDRDGIKITWAHRVNSIAQVDAALKDDSVLMLEADIRLRPVDSVPVMAHEESDIERSDITLKEWLAKVGGASKKGIKLDIKTAGALEPALKILNETGGELKTPIWINSDILAGPNTKLIPVDAKTFFKKTGELYPHCTLSAGWKTDHKQDGKNEYFSQRMIDEMLPYCKISKQPITFAVRASLVNEDSIEPLNSLLKMSDRYSLTVWHSTAEEVPLSYLLAIRKSFKSSQVFYDLPDKLMQEFQNALKTSTMNGVS